MAKAMPKLESASIIAHEINADDSKRYTVYKVEVLTGEGAYVVSKRYSEFRELYEQINKLFPKEKFKFPPKRGLMGSNFDHKFLRQREQDLNVFVQRMLRHPEIPSLPLTIEFFCSTPLLHGRGSENIIREGDLEDAIKEDPTKSDDKGMDFPLGEAEKKTASVEDFEMLRVIGKGSFGRVLLGKHIASGTIYAIKVLSKEIIVQQNEVKHIMSERNVLLGNVKHPFLVGMHYSFQTKTKLYFVLDYVNGGELFFHLQKEKRFSIPRSMFYAAQITSALGYMHKLHIVYRDLKPENILLDKLGNVVLTDFGLCKENVPLGGTTNTFCGTPEYLAPEVLKKHAYGRAVDWWCLGCVTYEMMTGLPPFYSRDCNEMYDRILKDKLRFPDFIPVKAQKCLEGLLIRIPDQRLGGGKEDAEEVKRHPFFETIDWVKLDKKELVPPFNPNVTDSLDLSNFDPVFTRESVPDSVVNRRTPAAASSAAEAFPGFTYEPSAVKR